MTDAAVAAGPRGSAPRAFALWLVAGFTAIWLLWRISDIVLTAFVAALLAIYLSSVTDWMCRHARRIPRGLGLMLSLFLTVAVLVGVAALLVPAVVKQVQDLVNAVPLYVTTLDRWIQGLADKYPMVRDSGIASVDTGLIPSAFAEVLEFAKGSVVGYAAGTGSLLIHSFAVIVMSLYLAWHPETYRDVVVGLVPPSSRGAANVMLLDVARTLRSWVGAQLLAMVVLAILTGIGLWLLSVPYWLAFSMFAGIVVMVPFFGSIVSTLIPALLILPDRGPLVFVAVALVGVVVHIIEANVVHPIIMSHRVSLPPVLTILSVLVMGRIGGLLGLLVAVPTLATAVVVVRHLLIYRAYGERPADVEAPPAVLRPSSSTGMRVVLE